RAALAAAPDLGSRQHAGPLAAGWFDLGDLRAVVGEQHRGNGPAEPRREVEHDEAVEHSGHHSPQTRAALPLTIRSRSSVGRSSNIFSTSTRELGQLDTGCG